MTTAEQRIEIGEACGKFTRNGFTNAEIIQNGFLDALNDLPDYPGSLEAMHQAEKTLMEDQQEVYSHALSQLIEQRFNCGPVTEGGEDIMVHREFDLLHAPAAQRAEAFLQTIKSPSK